VLPVYLSCGWCHLLKRHHQQLLRETNPVILDIVLDLEVSAEHQELREVHDEVLLLDLIERRVTSK